MNLPDDENPHLLKIIGLLIALALTTTAQTPDESFTSSLPPDATVHTLIPLQNGGAIVGGYFQTPSAQSLLKLESSGQVSTGFSVSVNGTVLAAARDTAGGVVIAGGFGMVNGVAASSLARVTAGGQLDTTFAPGAVNGRIRAIEILDDGRLLVAGDFTRVGATPTPYLACLAPDGSLDSSFQTALQPSFAIEAGACALAVQPDGKILVGGTFEAGGSHRTLLRLNDDGSLDTTFSSQNGPILYLEQIVVEGNGGIWICGTATSQGSGFLRKLHADGTPDSTFAEVTADGPVNTFATTIGDSLLIGGDFTAVNGEHHSNLARVTAAGEVDGFALSTDGPVELLARTSSGIFVAGHFSTIGDLSTTSIARLVDGGPQFQTSGTSSAGVFNSYLAGIAGKTYVVEASADLVNWSTFSTNTATNSGIEVVDNGVKTTARRFFRARQVD